MKCYIDLARTQKDFFPVFGAPSITSYFFKLTISSCFLLSFKRSEDIFDCDRRDNNNTEDLQFFRVVHNINCFFFFLSLFRSSLTSVLLLLISCTGSLSTGAFISFNVLLFPDHSPSERAWDEDDCQLVFQM